MPSQLRAYAVFGGGGVRGAALAGALAAAQALNIDFIGYAGVSAGSVIALLAAAGYSGKEIDDLLTKKLELAKLLDDFGDDLNTVGRAFERFQRASNGVGKFAAAWRFYMGHRNLLNRMLWRYGLYTGKRVTDLLRDLVIAKNESLRGVDPISFKALHDARHAAGSDTALKVLATDIATGRQVVFPDPNKPEDDPVNASVIDAVRASIGYPLVFQPKDLGGMRLVDGGVSSGLPVFLFESEFRRTQIPIIAFELGNSRRPRDSTRYNFYHFVSDLLAATLNSTDQTDRITTEGIHVVRLDIDPNLVLDFGRNPKKVAKLVDGGRFQARNQLKEVVQLEPWAAGRRDRLVGHVRLLLRSLVHQIEEKTELKNCRAYVMLRIANDKREVKYHFRMDSDPDRTMSVGLTEGPSGVAWEKNETSLASLDDYRAVASPGAILPPANQTAIISAPLREYGGSAGVIADRELPLLGTLSVDFSANPSGFLSPMDVAVKEFDDHAKAYIEQWADIISVQLKYASLSERGGS